MFRGFRFSDERISPVEFVILLSLKKGERHGYGIIKDLQEQFGKHWEVKSGSIYPALRRLEDRGFISTRLSEKDEREYYKLEEKGEKALEESFEFVERDLEFFDKSFDFFSERMPSRFFHGMGRCFPMFGMRAPRGLSDEEYLKLLERRKEFLEKHLKAVEKEIEELKDKLEKDQ